MRKLQRNILARIAVLVLSCGWAALLPQLPVRASDNSKSELEVFDLLDESPISYTPPPPIVITKPKAPTLQALQAQLFADLQLDNEEQNVLVQDTNMLAFWQAQPLEVSQINVPGWTSAVAADEKLIAQLEAQISELDAQIAALPK